MNPHLRTLFRCATLCAAALALSACGNKGPLVVPGAQTAAASKNVAAPATAKPADHNSAPAPAPQ